MEERQLAEVRGPTKVGLAENDDFTYVMGPARQAFEYQMGPTDRRLQATRSRQRPRADVDGSGLDALNLL